MTNSQLRAGPSRLNAQPAVQPVKAAPVIEQTQAPIELEPWDVEPEAIFVPTKTHAQLVEEMLQLSECKDQALSHPMLAPFVHTLIVAASTATPFTSEGQQKEFEAMLVRAEIKIRCTLGAEAQRAAQLARRPVQQAQPVYREKRSNVNEDATLFMAATMKYQAHAQTAAMRGWNSCPCGFCQEYRRREGISEIANRPLY